MAGSRCKPVVSVYDSDTNSRTQQDKPGESSSIKQTLADLDALLGIEEEKPKIEPQVGGTLVFRVTQHISLSYVSR